ncbi:Hint domain-containing protein [Acetobacteraceae bacterium]|nr:Hint domain-containing protein [Acetobacteraceae bacterium]
MVRYIRLMVRYIRLMVRQKSSLITDSASLKDSSFNPNKTLSPQENASLTSSSTKNKAIIYIYPPSTAWINSEDGSVTTVQGGVSITMPGPNITVVLGGADGNTGIVIDNLSSAVNDGATIIVAPEIKHFDDISDGFPPPGYVPPTYDPAAQVWTGGDSDGIILQGLKRSDIIGIYGSGSDLSNVPEELRKYLTGANAGNYALIQTKSGGWIVLHIDGIGDRGVIGVDKNGQIVFEVCYLQGTAILTPNGYKKVENLSPGDLVEIANPDGTRSGKSLPLKWIGKKSLWVQDGNPDLPPDEAGYAIRILKDAFGDNIPHKDLWVTPEHSFLFDGKFVPARMLVNGKTIAYDDARTSYTYYHLETDPHSILIAEGSLSESYLDTGNRANFISILEPNNDNDASILRFPPKSLLPDNKNWQKPAVPFETSRTFVEPLWKKLAHRAGLKQNITNAFVNAFGASVTNESNFAVTFQLPNGMRAPLVCQQHSQIEERHLYIFNLPPSDLLKSSTLVLLSRHSRPCDSIGPYVDDRRKLGVLIKNIIFVMPQANYAPRQWQTDKTLKGWANVEQAPMRWTTGAARLSLPSFWKEIKSIHIEIIAQGPYLLPSSKKGALPAPLSKPLQPIKTSQKQRKI